MGPSISCVFGTEGLFFVLLPFILNCFSGVFYWSYGYVFSG